MALGDIIVRRVEGANVSFANLPPSVKLAVICNTRGKNTDRTTTITRNGATPRYIDMLNTGTWNYPIREIGNALWEIGGHPRNYFINSHFVLASSSGGYETLNNTLLDITETQINNYAIKWLNVPLGTTQITGITEISGSLSAGTYYALVVPRGFHINTSHWMVPNVGPTDYGLASEPVSITLGNNSGFRLSWNPLEYGTGDYKILIKRTVSGIKWIAANQPLGDGLSPWLMINSNLINGTEADITNTTTATWKEHTTYLQGPSNVILEAESGTNTVNIVVVAYFENEQHSLPSVKPTNGYFQFTGVDATKVKKIEWTSIPGASGYYIYFVVDTGNWKAIRVEGSNSIEYIAPSTYIDLTSIGWNTGIAGSTDIFDPETGSNYLRPASEPYVGGGSRTLCFEPQAAIVPGGDYTLYYKYADKEAVVNKPTEYFTVEDVIADHGIGSEAANIARLLLGRDFVGTRSIVIVAPSSNTLNGYLNALAALEGADVQLIAATMYNNSLFQAMYIHCETLSDPVVGQKERYAIFSHTNNISWNRIRDEFISGIAYWAKQQASKGKRAFYGVIDGGSCSIAVWTDTNGQMNTDTYVYDAYGNDITPIIATILAFGKYLTLTDIATPLLEKAISGITPRASSWPLSVVQMLEDYGALVIQNRNGVPVVDSSTNVAYPEQPIEDSEMTIVITEDWIKKDLRAAFRQFRGQKFSARIVNAATLRLINKLTNYTLTGIIQTFDQSSVKVYQDAVDPTLLRAFFKYVPVYPIKKVLCEFDYAIARIGA